MKLTLIRNQDLDGTGFAILTLDPDLVEKTRAQKPSAEVSAIDFADLPPEMQAQVRVESLIDLLPEKGKTEGLKAARAEHARAVTAARDALVASIAAEPEPAKVEAAAVEGPAKKGR